MTSFILEIIMVVSLGVVLYLFARALPRVDDVSISSQDAKFNSNKLSVYLEKIDEWLKIVFEKFLRRVKVLLLKLDNIVSKKLNKFKKEPQKEMKLLSDEIAEKKEEKEGRKEEKEEGGGEKENTEDIEDVGDTGDDENEAL